MYIHTDVGPCGVALRNVTDGQILILTVRHETTVGLCLYVVFYRIVVRVELVVVVQFDMWCWITQPVSQAM